MVEDKNKRKISVKKFLLEIPEEIWVKWKDKIPRSISINKALISLLKMESEK